MRFPRLLPALLCTLALVACGGGDDDEPEAVDDSEQVAAGDGEDEDAPSGEDGGCLLLESEVEEVTGVDVEAPEPETTGDGCTYAYGDDDAASISVRVFTEYGSAGHDGFVEAFAEEAEAVGDLGDDAVWVPSIGTLDVLDGDDGIQVQIVDALEPKPIEDPKQAAIDLARLALASR